MYLWGGVGRGKTFLMDLFFAGLPPGRGRRRHFHPFMRDVHKALHALGRGERPLAQVAADVAARGDVLCLDELYVSDIGDAMILHGLLEGLVRQGVTLVITSNWKPSTLYRDGLQRERFLPAIALIEGTLDVVEFPPGVDFRQRELSQAETYLPHGHPVTEQRMALLFERLSGAPAAHGGSMDVDGRSIPVRARAGGSAWFDFSALCEGPRSQNDYIELARDLHTVFVSGVPVFDAGRDDAARRFIALVDELYDRRVKLVLSAAAEPDQLYRGERLSAGFGRTASRLVEMRSREYLGQPHQPVA
jgi:cell division protein ZapE